MDQADSNGLDLSFGNVKVTAVVFVVTLLLLKLMKMVGKKRYNLPPGPWGLPLVGYLPFFGPKPHVTFTELSKKYGDVISISMGSWPAVVISGIHVIQEALITKKDDFAGRPAFTTCLVNNGRNFALMSFGVVWKLQRRIVSNVIYTFSNARKNPVEDIIRSEAKTVIEEFLSHGKDSFCPLESLGVAGSSMIYQLCYGIHRNIKEDNDFMTIVKNARAFTDFTGTGNPVDVMPWLRHFMPWKISRFLELTQKGQQVVFRKVKEHEASFDDNALRDICDGLIQTGNQLGEEEKAVALDKRQVLKNLSSIFGAGSSTVSTTLRWFVALMATFPMVQEEVFKQIDTVVGQGRDITLADRPQLPLVEATVYEVLRYVGVIPFAFPHTTTRDTTLQGYDIPEGTVVLVNLYSIFMDDKLWGDPRVFRPQRFLDPEGQLNKTLVEQTSAFSLGRRRCVGEVLARMELFLFTATLLQRLRFARPPEEAGFLLKEHVGLAIDVEPFNVCVFQRD